MEPAVSLPDNLHRLRITDGHSIKEVADATRIPASVLHAVEDGRTQVSPRVLKALARHFRISEHELTS
jgi:transcriptional regulator with XRE-family HTH domain